MNRRHLIICILTLAFCFHISAQEAQEPLPSMAEGKTGGLMNGRGWRLINAIDGVGVAYVIGYSEGAKMNGDDVFTEAWRKCSCRPGDVANGITEFYRANPEYLRMPVHAAIALFIMKANGASRDTLDEAAAEFMRAIRDMK
jgi:hypothetical protein